MHKTVDEVVPHLSIRGRNLLFLSFVNSALQLDKFQSDLTVAQMKAAFTPTAIREVYQAVMTVWPRDDSYARTLSEEHEASSGLYVGVYEPHSVIKGVTRHSLYSERLILIDPLMFPPRIREEYNPLAHPEQYRETTVKWIWLWFAMAPWIEADLVHFIRPPGDFDPLLDAEAVRITEDRYARHAELEYSRKNFDEDQIEEWFGSMRRQMVLAQPDEYFAERFRESKPDATDEEIRSLIDYLQKLRDSDPFFIEPPRDRDSSQIIHASSGTNYEMAKWTAAMTGSHLITDIRQRWLEIAIDRAEAKVDDSGWTPFAKAFHDLPFRYLNNVPIESALTLRCEDRLLDLRAFLRKIWRTSVSDDPFSAESAESLALELHERVNEAQLEWDKIERDLGKWLGTELAVGALSLGPSIAVGGAQWAAAALAVGAVTTLVTSRKLRSEVPRRYPAAFFADLRAKSKQ